MKRNAIIIAGILFAASASRAQEESSDPYRSQSPSRQDTTSAQYAPDTHVTAKTYDSGDDISADSSVRGGSLDARGYDQAANNDEIEGAAHPINPGKQADSSIRGGSAFAREREWNHDAEPTAGKLDRKRYMKADSSIRGGSVEARGGREAMKDEEGVHYHYNSHQSTDDFRQGSSATWESDKGHGSVSGSANWNPNDDLMRDGMDAESQSVIEYERNNDASVGGAVSAETGRATLDDIELDYHGSQPTDPGDLNSSKNLERNISGEFRIDDQESKSSNDLNLGIYDPNKGDTSSSSISSSRSTDIVHDESDLPSKSDLSADIEQENREAVGAAAQSESGSSSSSEVDNNDRSSSFESKDPAFRSSDTPIRENDPNFLYRDNRAHGVGSLSTGEFGAATSTEIGVADSASASGLAREVQARLTSDNTSTYGPTRQDIVRNVKITASNGEVTLKGAVPSEQDKQMLEVRTAEMPGVKKVHNELTVAPGADAAKRDLKRGHDLEDQIGDLQD